jgi:hypothetical protein
MAVYLPSFHLNARFSALASRNDVIAPEILLNLFAESHTVLLICGMTVSRSSPFNLRIGYRKSRANTRE